MYCYMISYNKFTHIIELENRVPCYVISGKYGNLVLQNNQLLANNMISRYLYDTVVMLQASIMFSIIFKISACTIF